MLAPPEQPLVSCVMPTANRRQFVPLAIRYFQRQDYPHKELVILDDGAESVADLIPNDPQIRYVRLTGKRTLGAKRNACVEHARGDLIMHWDDDDWMAPHRISYQVETMRRAGAEVCGLRQMLYYELGTGTTWLYTYPANQRPWLAGNSLLYTRAFWRRSPFPNIQVASDTRFIFNHQLDRAAVLPDYNFYVAMIHSGNTSPKVCRGSYWSRWSENLPAIIGEDLNYHRSALLSNREDYIKGEVTMSVPALIKLKSSQSSLSESTSRESPVSTVYSIIMVAHNARAMTQMSTLRTLRHSASEDARLIVVDNASTDGTETWLKLLAQRGDIDLIRSESNLGHGPGLELARRQIRSPYVVTLDSDAFPLCDDWLPRLRSCLNDEVKIAGIRHHRDYIHPSCLMIARQKLEEFGLSFLNEKDRPSRLDVAERISCEIKRRGFQIAGLERTGAQRRGSISEPVYLGSTYEGIVYHQWYTTRAAIATGHAIDDVPAESLQKSLHEVLETYHAEARELTVVMGVRARPHETQRLRNARACLQALNMQDLPRWRYRIVVVEQDCAPYLETELAPLADRYLFAYNPGPYNRGWGFNIGATRAANAAGVLCLIDADLLVPPDFLSRSLATMQAGHRALLPYSEVIYLDAASTERTIQDCSAATTGTRNISHSHSRISKSQQGGCIWVDAALYEEIGGHDERFRGWGREDREFWNRLSQATTIARLPNGILHLDHPRPAMDDRWAKANQQLYQQIATASIPPPSHVMGDPNLYAIQDQHAGSAAAPTALGMRQWENWHRWNLTRIERIVSDERRQLPQRSARRHLAELLVSLGDRLLDVGCGPGAMWPHFEPHRPRFSWAGTDVTLKMVNIARRLFPEVEVYHADASDLPFDDKNFDVVLLRHVLEHLPDSIMKNVLTEAIRVARRAVVVDFYVPPISLGAPRTLPIGEGFLETRWTVDELMPPIIRSEWQVQERLTINSLPGQTDEVWVFSPQERNHGMPSGQEPVKFSIIMPTYRRSHTIHRTVETICNQTYRNWELIIIDNAGDGGYQFTDKRIRVYACYNQKPSASYARNQGLRHAMGDLVCFFDDDDDMFPEYLARFAAAFQAYPNAKMVRCGEIVSGGKTDYSFATPQCCLRKQYAVPTWENKGRAQDQRYFKGIVAANGWSEAKMDIAIVPEALCRAHADPHGGLRSGRL